MGTDSLLSTLLRVLQEPPGIQDTNRILGTIRRLLIDLANPLNLQLLVRQVLLSPAVWTSSNDLRFSLALLGIFYSASRSVIQREAEDYSKSLDPFSSEPRIKISKWLNAIIQGAIESQASPSRQALVLGGTAVGLRSDGQNPLLTSLDDRSLQDLLVRVINRGLIQPTTTEFDCYSILLALVHAHPLLKADLQLRIQYDDLLLPLVDALFHSQEGLQSGYFLQAIDYDVKQVSATQLRWPETSSTYRSLVDIKSKPLVQAMSATARLLAFTIRGVRDPHLVQVTTKMISDFAIKLCHLWRQNKLSEVDVSEEIVYLDQETLQSTLPGLWQLLRGVLFVCVNTLGSATGRMLADPVLAGDAVAPEIAVNCLSTLHNLNFIFTRMSGSELSQHSFVQLACTDVLNTHRPTAATFLRAAVNTSTTIPVHPLDRILDLSYLNTAEHLTSALGPADTKDLLVAKVLPYLDAIPNPALIDLFEAAHSVMLAIFAAPQNALLTAEYMPLYTETLFKSFPSKLSTKQFRLAFKTLIRLSSPPTELSRYQPLLAPILFDILSERITTASSSILPEYVQSQRAAVADAVSLSEQGVLILSMLDCLPYLGVALLREWLPLLPSTLHRIDDISMRMQCVHHLWDVFTRGDLDPERAQICVAWWTTQGGMEAVMGGQTVKQDLYLMSGGLPNEPSARI